jgi:hypothetical protein
MKQNRSAVALAARVAAFVLCAGVLAACAPAAAEEPSPVAPGVALTTPVASDVPSVVSEPQGTPAEAAGQFAAALVDGDLAAATRSFAPSGLATARALVNQRQTTDLSHFDAVTIQSVEAPADRGRWEVVFKVSSSGGESRLWTRWEWFGAAGWRIAAVAPLP